MPYFGIFGQELKKNYCHILNQHLRICLTAKILEKNVKTGDQKCLIWVFLGWNLKAILSYFKSTLSNLFSCKIS